MKGLRTVMISCHQRQPARDVTLPQFHQIGITPKVFLDHACDPSSVGTTGRVATPALEWAAQKPGPVLFIEDDIDLAPDFRWHLEQAIALDAVTYLYLNDSAKRLREHHGDELAARILSGGPIPRGAYALVEPRATYGTQCVLIPERLVGKAVELATEAKHLARAFDSRLQLWLMQQHQQPRGGERAWVMLPHPVQHRQDRTGRHGPLPRPRESLSYGLPWTHKEEP